MSARTIAVGDIHGCSRALAALLAAIELQPGDVLVPLGDYVDRGPDSRGVVDQLIALEGRCRLVPLLGNHDQMLLTAKADPWRFESWQMVGGRATLESYGGYERIPAAHLEFLQRCRWFHETETHLFVHANYEPHEPLADQSEMTLLWESLRDRVPGPHMSGKPAIVGHTSQKSGEILDLGHLKCIDTWCCGGGWLTAVDVESGRVWQFDREGNARGREGRETGSPS